MKARIKIDPEHTAGSISDLIYGQFLCRRRGVAERGLHDPTHPSARADGIRADVMARVADSRPSMVRWPGGCTSTTYHWEDGIGTERPTKMDLHFSHPATNHFGTDEFVAFCRELQAEPLIVWSMAVSSLEEGMAWLEYCNGTADTHYANLRRAGGHDEPHGVRYWQIGNEMYARHEIGHMSSSEYAGVAREWAKTAKRLDPSIKVIGVGGSDSDMNWYFDPLREAGEYLDYISMHTYWGSDGDAGYDRIVTGPHFTERTIGHVAAIIDMARREKALRHDIGIAFTEWNAVRPHTRPIERTGQPYQPAYRLTEALAVAAFLNVMIRHCRTVTLSTVAQTLNVVGLLTVNPDGVIVEPIYWPLWMMRRYAGTTAIDARLFCDETIEAEETTVYERTGPVLRESVPMLDVAATLDSGAGRLVLSVVNRSRSAAAETELVFTDTALKGTGRAHVLHHDDVAAGNSLDHPDNVSPRTESLSGLSSRWSYEFKPHSFTLIEIDLG